MTKVKDRPWFDVYLDVKDFLEDTASARLREKAIRGEVLSFEQALNSGLPLDAYDDFFLLWHKLKPEVIEYLNRDV